MKIYVAIIVSLFFLSQQSIAFIEPAWWVMDQMTKACGLKITDDVNLKGKFFLSDYGIEENYLADFTLNQKGFVLNSLKPADKFQEARFMKKNDGPTKLANYFLDEFIGCKGTGVLEKKQGLEKALTLAGVDVSLISLDFVGNEIAYVLGAKGQGQLFIDKKIFVPLKQIIGNSEYHFSNWQELSFSKKKVPTKIVVKQGSQSRQLTIGESTDEERENDARVPKRATDQ